MIVDCEQRGNRLVFRCRPEQRDATDLPGRRLQRPLWYVELVRGATLEAIHPDLIALASVLMLRPFSRTMTTPLPVSAAFAQAVAPLRITNVDYHLAPRARPEPGVPALAYSGGVDSTAALTILPADTVAVYGRARRPAPAAVRNEVRRALGRSHTKASTRAARRATRAAQRAGRRVEVLDTDLPWVRRPAGFPVDVACAVPLVLAADRHRFDCAAFGTVMESAYRTGHGRFEDYPGRDHWRLWSPAFAAVGLPFHLVTAGISEVGTAAISAAAPLGRYAQSCVRSRSGGACMRCFKCFRTTTVRAALSGRWPEDAVVEALIRSAHTAHHLRAVPIHHENVVAFAAARYTGSSTLYGALRSRVLAGDPDLGWMERWYPPSADVLAGHRAEEAVAAIRGVISEMDDSQRRTAEDWDLTTRTRSDGYRRAAGEFAAALPGAGTG